MPTVAPGARSAGATGGVGDRLELSDGGGGGGGGSDGGGVGGGGGGGGGGDLDSILDAAFDEYESEFEVGGETSASLGGLGSPGAHSVGRDNLGCGGGGGGGVGGSRDDDEGEVYEQNECQDLAAAGDPLLNASAGGYVPRWLPPHSARTNSHADAPSSLRTPDAGMRQKGSCDGGASHG